MINKEIKAKFREVRKTLRLNFREFVKGKIKAEDFAGYLEARAKELNDLSAEIKKPADPNKCQQKK
jgi:hypothetical protein